MPSSKRLKYLITDGYNQSDKNYCIDAYNQWLTCNCLHPQRLQVTDSHTCELRTIEIPCGKCYHCRETKINSWVTRMYAHLEDFKNAYFITLTYKSFTPNLHPAEKLMLDKLGDAAYVLDANNETKRICYSPSLLIKKHYQNFLKRLRKYSNIDDLSFVLCGEYGNKYGRPHFHAILFTNCVLTAYDIKRAWSVALFRDKSKNWSYKRNQSANNGTTYYVPIGKIDFNDLVANGSLNTHTKVKVDGNYLNARNCFAYVCKYICKQDSYNKMRVNSAYNQLFEKREYIDVLDNSFNAKEAIAMLRKAGIHYNYKSLFNLLKNCKNEEIIPIQGKKLYPYNFERSKVFHLPIDVFSDSSLSLEIIPRDYQDFCTNFAPFVEFSRGTPIGSLYANRHVHEFTQGIYKTPLLQHASFVLPRYFLNKARDYVYGFRSIRKTLKGTSFVLGDMPNLHRFMRSSLEDVHPRYLYSCFIKDYQDLQRVLQSEKCLVDKFCGIKYIFPVSQNNVSVQGYFYNRSTRKYQCVVQMSFVDFAVDLLKRLEKENEIHQHYTMLSNSRIKQLDFVQCLMADLGIDIIEQKSTYEKNQDNYLKHRNMLYDSLHETAE